MSMNTLITLEVKFYSAALCECLGLGTLGLEFFKNNNNTGYYIHDILLIRVRAMLN